MPPQIPQLPVTQPPGQQPGNWGALPAAPPQQPFAPNPGAPAPGALPSLAGIRANTKIDPNDGGLFAKPPAAQMGANEPFGQHTPSAQPDPKDFNRALVQSPWTTDVTYDPDTGAGYSSAPATPLLSRELPFKVPSWRTLRGALGGPHVLGAASPASAGAYNKAVGTHNAAVTAPEMVTPTVGDAATTAAAAAPVLGLFGKAKGLTGLVGKDPITGVGGLTQAGTAINRLAQGNLRGAASSAAKSNLQMIVPATAASVANQAIPASLPQQTQARLDADPAAAGLEQDPRESMGAGLLSRVALPFVAAKRTVMGQPGGVGDTLRHSFNSLGKLTDTAANNPDVFQHRVGRYFSDIGDDVRHRFDRTNQDLPVNRLKSLTGQEQAGGLEAAKRYEAAVAAGDAAGAEAIQKQWTETARDLRSQYEGLDVNAPGALANVGPAGQRVSTSEILNRLNAHYKNDPAALAMVKDKIAPQLDSQGLSLRPVKDYQSPTFASSFPNKRDLDNQAAYQNIPGRIPLLGDRRLPDVEGRLDAATKEHIANIDRLKNQTGEAPVGPQTPMPLGAPPGAAGPNLPQVNTQPEAPKPPQLPATGQPGSVVPKLSGPPAPSLAQPGANPWRAAQPAQPPAPPQLPATGTAPVAPAAQQQPNPGVQPTPAQAQVPITDEQKGAVGQKLQQMIGEIGGPAAGAAAGVGAGGLAGLMQKAETSPPPPGSEGFWSNLGPESKALLIAGLSVTALSALKNLTGGSEEGDGSFLAKVLPLLGLGTAAWGAGSGTFGITEKFQMPTGQSYQRLGNAISNSVGAGKLF